MSQEKRSYDDKVVENVTRELGKSRTLLWRLFTSPEVPLLVKAIPFLALLYWLSPYDALLIPFVGWTPVDDIAVILLGLKLFIELSPTDLVNRLRDEINYGPLHGDDNDEVIDATYHVLDDDH